MPYPHVIRLRGPWEYSVQSRESPGTLTAVSGALPTAGRIQLPADWGSTLGKDFYGRVRYARRFNCPTGLTSAERVWLVIEGVDAQGTAVLNGRPLSPIEGYALSSANDVTELLASANLLELDVEVPPSGTLSIANAGAGSEVSGTARVLRPGRQRLPGGPIGEARLEIRATAYLDNLALCWEPGESPRLHVRGKVGGATEEERLALAVTACNQELAFRELTGNEPFDVASQEVQWPCWPDTNDEPLMTPVEIRLLAAGATVWECVRETAQPQADEEPQRRAILARLKSQQTLDWHDYVAPHDNVLGEFAALGPGSVIGLRAILAEAAYDILDHASVAVVQGVPAAWAARVCPRLAHHPSIVAWGASPADLLKLGPLTSGELAYGRPWLACNALHND